MLTLNDGRNELWQWDTGRKLTVDADCTQVHFSNKFFGRSVDVDVFDGTAEIPDVLLQVDKDLLVWAFVGTAENGYTKISKVFKVNKRNKPADYVFTPPEQTTLGQIMERLDDLEAMQDPDAIKNAVDDYLANNPIKVEEKDPTVPDWAKQTTKPKYTATEVGAVAKVNGVSPDTNGNVTITVSDSGGNADYVGVEPAEDDIPKIFFGGALQQTKDEAVVPFRYISKTDDFSGYAEIKAQGNSSMSYPKKNQTVKMFKDAECSEKMKVDFKGWGKQNKYVYKANWIDLTHARNVVSARLWGDVVKSRANYAELPELLRTSPNQGAVDGFPVKVYADGVYQGRYTLNIPKDAWMANMDKDLDTHCILCGENYVSGCFRAAANINESDWTDEIHDVVPTSIKTRWNQVISFVMNSTDEEFRANLRQYFYVDSLIDYYLFGLASCGLDAFGKNQLYMTYDGQKWIATMYDMDSTWGLWWNGSSFVATDYDRSEYQDFKDGQGNLLYIRLENLFYEELQARWAELRSGALSIENIINRFERFTDIAPAELVKEDYASTTGDGKFTGIPSKTTSTIQQIRGYAVARHAWCDTYVAALAGGGDDEPDEPDIPENVPCTGITLDKTELTFGGEGTQTITATVTPGDTTDTVVWVSSAPAVASITVEGNVCTVQSVSNGNATITVTCGNQSATCTVTVSGCSNTAPIWSETAEYEVDAETGEVIAGESYVTDMFPVEKGYSYIWGDFDNRPRWLQLALYDEEGVLIWQNWSDGLFAVNLYDDSNISKARLVIPPEVGKELNLASAGLVKKDSWSMVDNNIIRSTLEKQEYSQSYSEKLRDHINLTRFPVDVGKTYRLSGKDGDTTTWKRIGVFDADDTLIYSTEGADTTDAAELTMPENAAYVRCSVHGTGTVGELLEFTEVN